MDDQTLTPEFLQKVEAQFRALIEETPDQKFIVSTETCVNLISAMRAIRLNPQAIALPFYASCVAFEKLLMSRIAKSDDIKAYFNALEVKKEKNQSTNRLSNNN